MQQQLQQLQQQAQALLQQQQQQQQGPGASGLGGAADQQLQGLLQGEHAMQRQLHMLFG
jgi:hypothetical protein